MLTIDLDALELKLGGHRSPQEGMCVMEAAAYFAVQPTSLATVDLCMDDLMDESVRECIVRVV